MSTVTTVVVAGASGAIGRRLIPLLVRRGMEVIGLTRSTARAEGIEAAGARPAIVDAYDRAALAATLRAAHPEVVIHQLTDLSTPPGQWIGDAELARTARLRDEGTANLVAAATAAGARRLVAQSIAWLYAPGPEPHDETHPLLPVEPDGPATVRGVVALERHVTTSPGLDGVVLRYGWLYGPGTGADEPWDRPGLHVDAAAWAAALAVDRGRPGIYNVAEDDDRLSSRKARDELGWDPAMRGTAPAVRGTAAAVPAG